MSLSTAKNELKKVLLLIDELKNDKIELENSKNNLEKFESILKKIKLKQNELNKLLEKYENSNLQKKLKSVLTKRINKRKKIKKRYKESLENRKKLHQNIDKSLDIVRKDIKESRAKDEEKKQTQNILSRIKNKIAEAKRKILYIKASGMKSFIDEDEYLQYSDMLSKWNDKLKNFIEEEKQIKANLGYNSKSLEDQWLKTLFGDIKNDHKNNIKRSELLHFFENRRIWDSYIVPSNENYGSSIPYGWILPSNSPSEKWTKYLYQEK